jgi:hypothetical protein
VTVLALSLAAAMAAGGCSAGGADRSTRSVVPARRLPEGDGAAQDDDV